MKAEIPTFPNDPFQYRPYSLPKMDQQGVIIKGEIFYPKSLMPMPDLLDDVFRGPFPESGLQEPGGAIRTGERAAASGQQTDIGKVRIQIKGRKGLAVQVFRIGAVHGIHPGQAL